MKRLVLIIQQTGGTARQNVSLMFQTDALPMFPQIKGFANSRRLRSKNSSLTDALWSSYQVVFENHCLAVSNPGISHKSTCNTETSCSYCDTKHICQKKSLINKV